MVELLTLLFGSTTPGTVYVAVSISVPLLGSSETGAGAATAATAAADVLICTVNDDG